MISINHNPGILTITGHAGAGPPGQDIVCAAVSVLLQTLAASIEALTDDKIEYDINPGNARLEYKHLSEKSRTLMGAFFIGISGIAAGYPECVTLIDNTIGRRGTEEPGGSDKATECPGRGGKDET